jgi:hypothetical protein
MAAGSIIIDLLMRTGAFSTDSDRAAKKMQQLQKEAVKVGKAIGAAFVAVGGATALLVKGSIDAMDNMAKLAQTTGTTVEGLSALTYAASLSGVSQDELGASLQKLSRTASEAAQGTAAASDAFKALGISVKDSEGNLKASDSLLGEIAEKFSQYEDGAAKTALAQELFGRSGAKLIPLLNAGAAGLEELKAEAAALGLVFDTDTSKAAERFNDNLTRLNGVKQGLVNRIAQQLLPTLENLSKRLFDSAKASGALDQAARAAASGVKILLSVGAIIVGAFKTLGETLGGVAAALVALFSGRFKEAFEIGKNVAGDFVGNIRGTIGTVGAIWDESASNIQAQAPMLGGKIAAPIIEAASKIRDGGRAIKTETDRVFADIEKQIAGIRREVALFGQDEIAVKLFDLKAAGASPDQLSRAAGALGELEGLKQTQAAQQKAAEDRKRLADEGAAVYDSTRTSIERLNIEEARLLDLYNKKAISWDTYTRAVFAANDALMEVKDTESELNDIANELGLTFTSAFEDAVVKGEKLSDVLRGLAQDILRITTRKLVTEPLGNLFSGLAKSALGSIGGSFFGGAKAGGGDVIAGRSFLVGENGPERFIPRTSGTILPNSTTMNRGGDTNINIQIPVSAPKDRATALQFGRDVSRQLSLAQSRNG